MSIAVITDSTAYLPEGFAQRHRIAEVPLHVVVEGKSALDGVEFGTAELLTALDRRQRVTTSRPTPTEFSLAYQQAFAQGASAVVSIHLSRKLSGTWESACLAAQEFPERVRVVDSCATAMGLGFAVIAAAQAAANAADPAYVESVAANIAAQTQTFFCLDTVEYLRRGGRISSTTALLGTALSVKPLLGLSRGQLVPLEKVRTTSRALARLVELARAAAGSAPVNVAVHHLGVAQRAVNLAAQLDDVLPNSQGCVISEVGAVIGAHTGPGVLGVVISPRLIE